MHRNPIIKFSFPFNEICEVLFFSFQIQSKYQPLFDIKYKFRQNNFRKYFKLIPFGGNLRTALYLFGNHWIISIILPVIQKFYNIVGKYFSHYASLRNVEKWLIFHFSRKFDITMILFVKQVNYIFFCFSRVKYCVLLSVIIAIVCSFAENIACILLFMDLALRT